MSQNNHASFQSKLVHATSKRQQSQKDLYASVAGGGGGGEGVVEDEGSDCAPGRGTEADFCLFRSPLASGMKS